jgi:hypothetical protein
MKKLFILSVFALVFALFSCTADSLPQAAQNKTNTDIGGQTGQIPINPPKP